MKGAFSFVLVEQGRSRISEVIEDTGVGGLKEVDIILKTFLSGVGLVQPLLNLLHPGLVVTVRLGGGGHQCVMQGASGGHQCVMQGAPMCYAGGIRGHQCVMQGASGGHQCVMQGAAGGHQCVMQGAPGGTNVLCRGHQGDIRETHSTSGCEKLTSSLDLFSCVARLLARFSCDSNSAILAWYERSYQQTLQ